jgi:hypothetical protein
MNTESPKSDQFDLSASVFSVKNLGLSALSKEAHASPVNENRLSSFLNS